MRTYNEVYLALRNALRQENIEACNLEAKLLLAHASGKDINSLMRDMNLYTTEDVARKAAEYTARRIKGEPVAYIIGSWEFYGLPIIVNADVLIPRMDTEVLVDAVKEILVGRQMDARILDLCCGSGCITCAIAKELPATRLTAVDISALALDVCRKNLEALKIGNRVLCRQADVTIAPPVGFGKYDMIVSNPPYISTEEIKTLDVSVRNYEPMWALDGGADGLKFYKAIIKYWQSVLNPGGRILFEVGEGQAEAVGQMLDYAGFKSVEFRKDTLGVDRVVIGRLSSTVLEY